ncbi:potassium/proton antiporter [Geminocystis herdmanii]|uniref:potassium/proton antiporter n=1 Tax=Geminocystis herdmanii TaxID=669359 RepID=UPI000345D8DD|nr:potassium/proton antiporter [Geminocystis herdmanii]
MTLSIEQIFIIVGILLLSSVFASKISNKFGIPALLLFLLIGILAGSEGIGGIKFDDYIIARYLADTALTLILFAGGLDTEWKKIKPLLKEGLILSTVGVVITTLLVGTFAWLILGSYTSFSLGTMGITWIDGLLLGAIISSTDAAAVFSILKSSQIKLKNNIQPLLELESGSNDPVAILLTTSIIGIITMGDFSPVQFVTNLVIQIILGILFGCITGFVIVKVINRIRLNSPGLYPVCSVGLLLLSFGITASFNGNAFLDVYIAGIIFREEVVKNKDLIVSFHDSLSWLMQIIMFLTLGLLVLPSQFSPVVGVSVSIALFLIFVARPLSVFLCLSPIKKYNNRQKLFISWVGLRGAVPIILSLMPVINGIENGKEIFNLVFFLVITSILIQGLSLVPMAKFLKVVD